MDSLLDETITLLKSINDKEAIKYIYLIVKEVAREQAEEN